MSIGTGAAIALGVGTAAGLGSSLIGSSAAKSASQQQTQATDAAIAEQQREFNLQQQNLAPWLQAGQGALGQLTAGTQPGGALVQPFGETYQTPAPFSYGAFVAPTGITDVNDPGYQARLAAGLQAVQRGQAAGGGAFSGGTLKALTRYGQDYASNEYQNVYNRALQGYGTNFANAYNTYNTNVQNALQGYDTRFNTYQANQGNLYNRLAALSGVGQTAAGQLANAGQASTQNITGLLTGLGNAQAAGTLGGASAWNTGLGGITGAVNNAYNIYQQGQLLNMLTGGGGGSSGGSTGWV
jgi:hypothetical protein